MEIMSYCKVVTITVVTWQENKNFMLERNDATYQQICEHLVENFIQKTMKKKSLLITIQEQMTISGFSSRIASDASCFLTHGPLSPRDPLSVAIMVIVTIGSCRSPDNKELAHNRNIIVFFSLISHLQAAQVFEEKNA
jgi:hypothetical protein